MPTSDAGVAGAPTAAQAAATWRPQTPGRKKAGQIPNPLIEPLWTGRRALVLVDHGEATIRDETGQDLTAEQSEIAAAIGAASLTGTTILDGWLTRSVLRDTAGTYTGPEDAMPSLGQTTRRLFVGGGHRNREKEVEVAAKERLEAQLIGDGPVAFVAIDVLWIDAEAVLDVPLLERKRLLEAVLAETTLVRRGIFVRPPVDPWLAQWRGFGFRDLSYQAANARYAPGQRNDAWATARLPRL